MLAQKCTKKSTLKVRWTFRKISTILVTLNGRYITEPLNPVPLSLLL